VSSRYSRQTRLAEVGETGQARLAAGHVFVVADGLAGEVQARYLAGAGVGTLHVLHEGPARAASQVNVDVDVDVNGDGDVNGLSSPSPSPSPSPSTSTSTSTTTTTSTISGFGIRDEAAREVALGAWRALHDIRALLGVESGTER
jgi:hypothetical protein